MKAWSAKEKQCAGLALSLAILLVYASSLANGFHFDDFHTIVDNPAIRSLRNVPRFFTDATTFSVLPANRTYRPVVSFSLALDYALGQGLQPWAFHAGTLVAFVGLALLLRALVVRVLEAVEPAPLNAWLALGVAAWFGLHPVMAETVNYVIQRGDVYCTLGCVASLVLYACRPAWRRLGVYLLPFALALLSKPPAAVFPALLFLYVLFFEPAPASTGEGQGSAGAPSRERWKKAAVAAAPALVLDGLLLLLQARMTPPSFTPTMLSASAYRLTEPYVWLRYIAALFLPVHLNVDTDLEPIAAVDGRVLLGCLLLAALAAAIVFTFRRRRLYPICFGLLWFVLKQLPTSLYPLSEVENDHRMFFSFPGLMLAAVWSGYLFLRWLASRLRWSSRNPALAGRVTVGLLLCLLCGYAYGAHRRNAVWHDEESLWRDDVQKSPRNGRGLMIYGLTLMQRGDYVAALSLFQRALVFTPNYATLEINLGVVNGALADSGEFGKVNEAEAHFRRALALAPNDDTAHSFYARWLIEHGQDAEAVPELEEAVRLNPARTMPWELLSGAYARTDRGKDAQRAEAVLTRMEPGHRAAAANATQASRSKEAEFWINASLAQYRAAQWGAALQSARRALVLDPRSAEAHNNLAAAYGAVAQWDLALHAAQEALALDPNLQIARNNALWFTERKAAEAKLLRDPTTAQDFVELSLRLYRAAKFGESLDAARRATQLEPALPEAWNNIAAAAEALHHWDEAIAAARQAVSLRPGFQLAENNLAWSLEQQRRGVQ